jgi:hypothetical protein
MTKKRNAASFPSPVIGSSITPREFKRITGHRAEGENASQPMQEWQLRELNSDIHLMLLERMIDDSIFSSDVDEDVIVDIDYSPITYEILSDEEEMPSELKHFIRSLEKLVQRTQRQLNLYNKKKTEN